MRNYIVSAIGAKLSQESGILELMNDLGETVALRPDMLTLGGGNPAEIPEMQTIWRKSAERLMKDGDEFDKALAHYDAPQGETRFLDAFAAMFREQFNLPISRANVAVTSGAQLGAFSLFNLLAGQTKDGRARKILVPLVPEYVGYADMGVEPGLFIGVPGKITYPNPDDRSVFKYAVDFNSVEAVLRKEDVAAILLSRPTNPSGNLITRAELVKLDALAEKYDALLIVDNAYGGPFPGILEDKTELDSVFWTPRAILFYSLSKIGLPSLRTAMIIAPEEIVERVSAMTAILGLANNSLGQRLAFPLVQSSEILSLSREVVLPYYRKRRTDAIEIVRREFARVGVDVRLHKSEGAFFLWLWTPELKCGSKALYRRLKEKGVLAIPGSGFFYGLSDMGVENRDPEFERSREQTLRVSFSSSELVVERGLRIIAETIAEMTANSRAY